MSFAEIEQTIDELAGTGAQTESCRSTSCKGARSRSATAAFTGRCCRRRLSIRLKAACWACMRFKSGPWFATARLSSRPMMYVALSYDHRIVDGREAVSFLKRIKEVLEEPARMLIEA